MKNKTEKYGIFTAVAMIVGVCIGSGIFFKSDNVLIATGGNIPLGAVVFTLGAISIIFGGLCLSQLAARTDAAGGVITYFEKFCGKRLACGFGWFQIFIYFPTLVAVVAWVVVIYISILFNLHFTLGTQIFISFLLYSLCFLYNTLSTKIGAIFQNITTIVKLIPLVLIAILGLLFGNPSKGFSAIPLSTLQGVTWLSAVGPIAFSYDGWIVSTSISNEIKNSKRNLPIALVFAPIFILIIYVSYFIGVTCYIGPENVINLGDAHVSLVATKLFGTVGAKAILIFVIISVMGTLNGLVLGFIRLPYSLSLKGKLIPFSDELNIVNEKYGISIASSIFAYCVSVVWSIVHYITTQYKLLPNSDISEISIAISYIFYIFLYYQVYKLYHKKEIRSAGSGIIVPIMATIGSLFILSGALQNKLFIYYATFCAMVFAVSLIYFHTNNKTSTY
ncbi:APC family permease [Clostridium oryzae]|uniref:Serine/threonine exchanger SteT n=1 Tax=Clostridium oryzae TaxID=1450648 RepID=A0A1V4IND4_9CLOT|nr:amino acid permease [Clostridium oryzae]OPJ61558.1 serine/threonine exchanger SteT [Clostridium oryzae]